MSSDSKSGVPSNEEVIDELTKDLRDSAIKTDSYDDSASHISESDSETDAQVNKDTEIKDEDYIDDTLLKERDEQLPEEEKRVSINHYLEYKDQAVTILKVKNYFVQEHNYFI